MTSRIIRTNEQGLRWARAGAFAVAAWLGLDFVGFQPAGIATVIALVIGGIALFSPATAVLVSIVAISLPVLAADFVAGLAFVVLGVASTQFLSSGKGRVFLLVSLGFFGAQFGPAWAAAALAGYLLGASEGAIAAIIMCLLIEAAGLFTGVPAVGAVATGGAAPAFLDFTAGPENLTSFGWLADSTSTIDPKSFFDVLSAAGTKTLLLVQHVVWALGAVAAGAVRRPPADPRHRPFALLAVTTGIAVLAAGSLAALQLLGSDPVSYSGIITTGLTSLLIATVVAAALEWVFPTSVTETAPAVRPGTMSSEDADVDELLRLIAAAEDQLASKHTTHTVVMITDMKSFSRMTEEDGSVTSAKTIQRHRDLLMPIISERGGRGKSTGGDGLVAAFDTATDAVGAAAHMQNVLREYNSTHTSERDIVIRIGIAEGEVVLDKGGRPFIGMALNLAARVMNLADGGQVFVTERIADAAKVGDVRQHLHGRYDLKNIAEPVGVIEILWAPDQEPLPPGGVS
jgi:class 3 adenylate cyclase